MPRAFLKNPKAQAAAEMAIFGAIMLFVISLIVRTGLSAGLAMNGQLRALRYAFTESYRTSQGQYSPQAGGGDGSSAARNSANILLVEDRLSADAGNKLGTRDRIPIIVQSSGTFSPTMFLPVEEGETWNQPVLDIIINGQRFPFTIAGSEDLVLDDSLPSCDEARNSASETIDPRCWERHCLKVGSPDPGNPQNMLYETQGCPVIYRMAANSDQEWCYEDCKTNMDADERFDLDFNNGADVSAGGDTRKTFSWQWLKVPVVPTNQVSNLILDAEDWAGFDWDNKDTLLAAIRNPKGYATLKESDRADIDGDHEEEIAEKITYFEDGSAMIKVFYKYKGELDLSSTNEGRTGLKMDEMQMFSFTKGGTAGHADGTVLRIEERKLYDSDGKFIRNTTYQDNVDIIQRRIVLNKNTGRFCDWQTMAPRDWSDNSGDPAHGGWNAAHEGLYGLKNPVEVCVEAPPSESMYKTGSIVINDDSLHGCFSAAVNIKKTCMQKGSKDYPPQIFVRSRIKDLRGRKWVTRLEEE